MKISKIYSNNPLMRPIIFEAGFNVIYGDVENDIDVNEHNLGKTSLVHLIDFLLLKKLSKKHFLSKYKDKFKDWVFFIEIELNNGDFLTIKRPVKKSTLISFKKHKLRNQDFSATNDWDEDNIKLNAKKNIDAITILESYLSFNVLKNFSIRHYLAYILRTQYDYEDVFKMRQFEGKDIDWKPQLFSLLGYEEDFVIKKYLNNYDIEVYKNYLNLIFKDGNNQIDSYNLKAAIREKEEERDLLSGKIDKFDFYLKEDRLNKKLIEDIEIKISKLNSEKYRLNYELGKIKQSLASNINFDIDEVREVFEEAKIYFDKNLVKSYEELIEFNKNISYERAKYLKKELAEISTYLFDIDNDLKKLNQEKVDILSFLKNTDTFSKYKVLQNDLSRLNEQINQYIAKLDSLRTLDNYENKIEDLKIESLSIANKIKEVIDSGSEIFNFLNDIFKNIFKNTMGYSSLIIVKPNKEGNPHFEIITLDEIEDNLTGQGDGYSSTKVQCAAFVLAFLSTYKNESFFRFAYQDGIMESWGDNPKQKFLKEVRLLCKESNIQYIISVIKSDIPDNFRFEEGEVVATLTSEKPLFGFSF